MNPQVQLELERLLSALCDGALTEEDHGRLEELLAQDASCRRYYLEYVDMHARLLAHPSLGAGGSQPPAKDVPAETLALPAPAKERRRAAQALRYLGVAALTLAASFLLQLLWLRPHTPDANHNQPNNTNAGLPAIPVASLVQTTDCIWEGAHEPLSDGARLEPGKVLLQKGVARIRFDGGSELLLQGPAELRVDSSTAATLLQGKVVFRSDVMAAPFHLNTPAATLVDIGTEYGVSVSAAGEEVHVFEGDVQRLPRTGAPEAEPEYLQAGEACRSIAATFASQPVKFDPTLFVRHLSAPVGPLRDPVAGLLAYEGFDYKAADALQTGKATGGRGWLSPWIVTAAQPLEWGEQKRLPLNVGQSLHRPDSAMPSIGGRFDHAGFGVYYRQMATPVRLDIDGAYYISCLFRRGGPPGHPQNTVALMLRPNEKWPVPPKAKDVHRPHPDKAGDRVKSPEMGHRDHGREGFPDLSNRLMIGAGGSNQMFTRLGPHCARASLPIASDTSYLLVAKIVASRSSADQVFVRVYGPREQLGAEEPACWTVTGPAFHSDLVLGWLGIHVNSKNRQMIDEIRVGSTWYSVTGPWIAVAGAAKAPK
jgi:ferric-dicitrate binding protein FerR (iron transport regulator)